MMKKLSILFIITGVHCHFHCNNMNTVRQYSFIVTVHKEFSYITFNGRMDSNVYVF
jgi:hypothetical protein